MNINITTSECAWANFSVTILTRNIKGLRGFAAKKEVEKEELFGSGDEPIDLMTGQKKYSGNVKLLGFEVDAMNAVAAAAGFGDITEVPHELIVITISYKRRITDKLKSYVASGVGFLENGVELDNNAKHREITLPYKAMNVEFNTL